VAGRELERWIFHEPTTWSRQDGGRSRLASHPCPTAWKTD